MQWKKLGVVFDPRSRDSWIHSHALQPTPLLLASGEIRVFVGFRDREGIGRVGYVDVDATEPTRVITYSKSPSLEIGDPGCFDDNGVVPSAIVRTPDSIRLYYAGYQLQHRVRFAAFGGLAISWDEGRTFVRHKHVPVMDRTENERLFRVPHSVILDPPVWRIWYGGGSHFIPGASKTYPVYDIRYIETSDGINFPEKGRVVLTTTGSEYRLGRPYVVKQEGIYRMYFGASSPDSQFKLAYAESEDGISWARMDDALQLDLSKDGFDSEMMAYQGVITVLGKTYIFYNGNNYGESGFGVAILLSA